MRTRETTFSAIPNTASARRSDCPILPICAYLQRLSSNAGLHIDNFNSNFEYLNLEKRGGDRTPNSPPKSCNCVQVSARLSQANHEELEAIRQKLRVELKSHREQGFFTVAFVGQYSAGKSTIISALTGRWDIHIDADIATDTTASYDWNGIKLIDTPGLFTDRPKHDEITYEAIDKIAASNTWVKQLAEIRKDFELILRYITKATENSVV